MINIPTPLTTRSGNWSTLFNKLKFQRRKDFLFVLMALPLASPLMAQSPLVPTVEWRMISAEHERAGAGTYNDISFDGTEWVHTPSVDQNYGASQTPEQSGEDWYYGHCNIRSGANVVGILAAGYVTWPNWTFRGATGCASSVTYGGPNIGEFETSNHRKGEGVGYVAKHDLDGHEVWSKCLLPGLLRNAIQDADNNFLVVGNAYTNAWAMDPGDGNNPVIGLNGIAGLDMNDVDCGDFTQPAGTKGYVSKLGSDGHIIWTTMCNGELGTDQETNWNVGSYLTDIVAVTIPGTAIKYCAVGMTTTTGVAGLRPLLVYLDNDGTPVERYTYAPGTPANWSAGNVAEFISIDVQGTDLFITGYSLGSGIPAQAFGMLLHAGTDRFNFPWRHFTADLGDPICNIGLHNPNSTYYTNNSTGGGFVPETGGVHIVWPTMGNFSEGSVYGGSANVATLLVHGLDLDGTLLWTTDLGEVRAYDLQSDMTPTADGKVALVSTKLSGADLTLPSLPISWDDFSPSQKACLNGTFGFANPDLPNTTENEAAGVNWDYDGSTNPESGNDPTGLYHYWNTYAYVAKLDPETGNLIWQTQFDAHPGVPGACPYANMRKQECMYKISETDDGGLVVSGNTSDNFDDFYLAELNDCQTRVNYAGSPALDPNNEHHITSPTTWSSDMNVHGKIIVDPGATLTINNNAVISFADSKQLLDHPTELVVAKGGRLDVNGNARLTSIAQCPNSMWDGIRVMGDSHLSQDPVNNSPQGMASLSASTIENARAALLTGDASFDDPTGTMHGSSAGGYIRASLMTFKNKRYDVVMRKFENRDPHDFSHILNNRSYFDRCAFAEDALLNDGNSPRDHVHLNGVRGINYTGCSFAGVYQPDQVFHGMTQVGTGIRSINSSFSVRSKCTILLSYGQTCPPQNLINSTFDKLGQGVTATALTPDKTFIVDRATFTNCPRGIRTDGVRNAGITRNSFSVVDYLNPNVLGTPFGAYLDQCTGYKIQNNAFTSTGSHQKSRVGLVIKDSGPEYNTFYNNTFDDFISAASVGSLIEGDNANAQADYLTGLEVMCNEYGQFDGPNRFDVALTGQEPTVQRTQGKYLGPSIITAPAGNLFSLEGEAESDWDVSNASNYVTYYSHGHNGSSEPWIPQYYDIDYLLPAVTPVHWPQDRADACPDNFDNDGRLEKMQQSAAADADLADSKDAYDATKDNGDTYTLESYVADPGHSSTQVRNALQSVAPKVSTAVWKAVFAREPAMDPWPLTQALVSNSPLQPEVTKMGYDSELDDFYYNLVVSAQSGDVNVLSQLESEMAKYAGDKGEALTDLGRLCWLDTTDVGTAMEYLKLWHDSLPADDGASVLAGYYAAKGDMPALYSMAEAEKLTSATPEIFEVLKRYADHELNAPDDSLDAGTVQWLTDLAADRWTIGSAQASAWLQGATGADPLDEVIILPDETEQRSTNQRRVRNRTSQTPMLLQAYPNPSDGPVYVVCNVPEGVDRARLSIRDLNGRLVKEIALDHGAGIAEIQPGFTAAGIYLAELQLDGIRAGQVKLALQ